MAIVVIAVSIFNKFTFKIPGLKYPFISWDDAAGARFAGRLGYSPDSAG